MRVKKGQTILKIALDELYGAYWIESEKLLGGPPYPLQVVSTEVSDECLVFIDTTAASYPLQVVSTEEFDRILDRIRRKTASMPSKPTWIVKVPDGLEFFPAAHKSGKILVRYGMIHER